VKPLLALMRQLPVKGMAHITGGGLVENVPRVLPEAVKAVVLRSSWTRPSLFQWLQREGGVAEAEMQRVFNCGIGMIIVVAAEHADATVRVLSEAGETACRIGRIEARKGGEPQLLID
jgi:phosphoribosylformylglycinamidine cyclo-ligase